ncbi:MAG: hypothetical protein [Anelloviridae sp.]|nr:MAG: hypothetical protein [Anelloviridae sp.]
MSSRFIKTTANIRQQKLKWMNQLCHTHDMLCDCPSALEHTISLIFEQEPALKFKPQERDLIKKCLTGITTDTANTDQDNDGFGEGDLEELFKEDFGEGNADG